MKFSPLSRTSTRQRPSGTPGRVCVLTTVHPWNDVRVYYKTCRTLADAGYDVSLAASKYEGSEGSNPEVVPIAQATNRLLRLFGPQRDAWRTIQRLDPEIVHLHDPELLVLGQLLQRQGRKVIFDAHESIDKQILAKHYIPSLLRRPLAAAAGAFTRRLASRLACAIGATDEIAESFDGPHVTVRNLPLLSEFPDAAPTDQRSDRPSVVYVGVLARARGIAEAVTAMSLVEHPTVQLDLAGNFVPTLFAEEVEALDGWDRTTSHGWLDRPSIAELLAKASIGIVALYPTPNHCGSMPVKMMEYMAAGLPVIASDFPAFREIGGDSALYVDPHDATSVARAVDSILSDPERALEMGRSARERVVDEFNWERESTRLLSLYQELSDAAISSGAAAKGDLLT